MKEFFASSHSCLSASGCRSSASGAHDERIFLFSSSALFQVPVSSSASSRSAKVRPGSLPRSSQSLPSAFIAGGSLSATALSPSLSLSAAESDSSLTVSPRSGWSAGFPATLKTDSRLLTFPASAVMSSFVIESVMHARSISRGAPSLLSYPAMQSYTESPRLPLACSASIYFWRCCLSSKSSLDFSSNSAGSAG